MMNSEISEERLQELFAWIDQVPLSRAKRNITRDFGDGVLVAEVVKHFLPKIVEMHNYIPANSSQQKLSNWGTLNRKVFSKLNFHVPDDVIHKVISNNTGMIETVLYTLREKINEKLQENSQRGSQQVKDSEYYSTKTGQPAGSSALLSPSHRKAFPGSVDQNQNQLKRTDGRLHQYPHVEPRVRLLLEEKEQEMMALQETVQILQMKVQRLEHLVHLKDLRIEDLTKHINKQRGHRNIT